MMRLLPLALLLSSPAAAEPWTCDMTVRCDLQECIAIAESYTIIAADHEGQLFLTTPAGTRPVARVSHSGTLIAEYASDGPLFFGELLTIAPDGVATHTTPPAGTPIRIHTTYGICEAL